MKTDILSELFEDFPLVPPIKMDENYDYLRRGAFSTLFHELLFTFAVFVLRIYNFFVLGLRIKGWKNRRFLGTSGAVAVCNHVHTLDCSMIARVLWPKRQYFVTLQSNLELKGVRHLVRVLGGIPIPRDKELRQQFPQVLQQALSLGAAVPIYPEGSLHRYCRELRPFTNTPFATAWRAGVPVLPMCITFRKPRGIWRLKKKPCLTLHILPSVLPDPTAPKGQDVVRMREETLAKMQACLNQNG